jgi:hypothetical protein
MDIWPMDISPTFFFASQLYAVDISPKQLGNKYWDRKHLAQQILGQNTLD